MDEYKNERRKKETGGMLSALESVPATIDAKSAGRIGSEWHGGAGGEREREREREG